MKARTLAALAAVLLLLTSSGCAAILEGETGVIVSPHVGAVITAQPGSAPEASSYEELKEALMELVRQRSETGQILIYSYDGDVSEDLSTVCEEIMTKEPLGAYALADITAEATQIVSYFEVEAELSFKRTRAQIDAVAAAQKQKVYTLRYFRSELLGFMSDYADNALVFTDVRNLTADEVAQAVRELYYENPLSVVMLPTLGIEMFPPDAGAGEQLFVLTFNYRWQANLLAANNRTLRDTVSLIAAAVSGGDNDGMILLELARTLAESCVYNEVRAATTAEHGGQNFEATAYGALCDGSAVGEGYAMAFKALCDVLDIECHVVRGTLGGAAHAWNIVALEGDYYHIDVAMCSKNGIETAFLLRDADMPEIYEWDRQRARVCGGELTYLDFADTEAEAITDAGEATEADAGADADADTEADTEAEET